MFVHQGKQFIRRQPANDLFGTVQPAHCPLPVNEDRGRRAGIAALGAGPIVACCEQVAEFGGTGLAR